MGQYGLVDLLISLVLSLIMFGIGLSLTFKDFKNILIYPKSVTIGLMSQMIALPIIAFIFCYFTNISPELKVGLIILSVCPGGTTSNFITYLLNGNTALSVSMTTINSFLTLVSIPFIVNLSLKYFLGATTEIHLPYLETILQIFFITILPASIGVLINVKLPKVADKLNSKFSIQFSGYILQFNLIKSITIVLLGIVFCIKLFTSKDTGGVGLTKAEFFEILPIGFLFNITGLLFGYLVSKLLLLGKLTSMTIGIEVGLQNTTLAFLVAGTLLNNMEMQKPALVYAFFSFWTAIIFGIIVKKKG